MSQLGVVLDGPFVGVAHAADRIVRLHAQLHQQAGCDGPGASQTTPAVAQHVEAEPQPVPDGLAGGDLPGVLEVLFRRLSVALLHGPEQIADLPVPVVESPGAVRIGHPERGHLVEYLAPNSVFNSLPRQRSCPLLGPDDRFVTIDRVLHHASLGAA